MGGARPAAVNDSVFDHERLRDRVVALLERDGKDRRWLVARLGKVPGYDPRKAKSVAYRLFNGPQEAAPLKVTISLIEALARAMGRTPLQFMAGGEDPLWAAISEEEFHAATRHMLLEVLSEEARKVIPGVARAVEASVIDSLEETYGAVFSLAEKLQTSIAALTVATNRVPASLSPDVRADLDEVRYQAWTDYIDKQIGDRIKQFMLQQEEHEG